MFIVDTHCHLYFDAFDADREKVLERMAAAGVVGAVVVGIDSGTSRQASELAAGRPGLYYSAGLHPTSEFPQPFDAAGYLAPWLESANPPAAIGECGIDLHWDVNPLDRQVEVFAAQLRLARECGLPVIVHTRDANRETEETLRSVPGVRGVLHCFNGSPLLLEFALENDWYVGFAGNLTFPKAQELREAALRIPLERLLVETDAPFLAPQPVRGKRCEPTHVVHTAKSLTQLRGVPEAEMFRQLVDNSNRLFGVEWSGF
ncbi:TatD family hydrolase [bacterium]|nr:TatD family hydrolase [bacterium]